MGSLLWWVLYRAVDGVWLIRFTGHTSVYWETQNHLYNICTMLDQRRRRWADMVQMLYKCFVYAGNCSSHIHSELSRFRRNVGGAGPALWCHLLPMLCQVGYCFIWWWLHCLQRFYYLSSPLHCESGFWMDSSILAVITEYKKTKKKIMTRWRTLCIKMSKLFAFPSFTVWQMSMLCHPLSESHEDFNCWIDPNGMWLVVWFDENQNHPTTKWYETIVNCALYVWLLKYL